MTRRIAELADDLVDRSFHVFMRAADEFVDAYYGVDTRRERRYDEAATQRTRHGDPATNMPSYYLRLLALRRFLKPGPGDVAIDLGCGDGRALCVFARARMARVRGVDFDPTACMIARKNLEALRRRRVPADILEGDAAEHRFTDETIVYLFNPFGPATLRAVLRNLRASLAERPRRVRLCYYHPWHGDVVTAAGWLRPAATLKGIKTDIAIYEAGADQ